jgi:hypothetical protein
MKRLSGYGGGGRGFPVKQARLLRCMSPLLAHHVVGRSSAFGELRLSHRETFVGKGTQLCLGGRAALPPNAPYAPPGGLVGHPTAGRPSARRISCRSPA